MRYVCLKCGFVESKRDNVYGTICSECKSYVPPIVKPKLVLEVEEKFIRNQEIIRNHLRKQILGENNGNQIKQEN